MARMTRETKNAVTQGMGETMDRPDRFERVVEREATRQIAQCRWFWAAKAYTRAVERLLRTEHRTVVKLVQEIENDIRKVKKIVGKGDVHAQGMMDGVQCVLAAMTRYANGRGTP